MAKPKIYAWRVILSEPGKSQAYDELLGIADTAQNAAKLALATYDKLALEVYSVSRIGEVLFS